VKIHTIVYSTYIPQMDLEKDILVDMADGMLNDVVSSRAYEWVFKRYDMLFKDKVKTRITYPIPLTF